MITNDVSTLKIHKLTQAQYDRELAAGNLDENALYLTPDDDIEIADVVGLQSVLDSKQAAGSYASSSHTHDDRYYYKAEIDATLTNYLQQVYLVDDGEGNLTIVGSSAAAAAAEGVEF